MRYVVYKFVSIGWLEYDIDSQFRRRHAIKPGCKLGQALRRVKVAVITVYTSISNYNTTQAGMHPAAGAALGHIIIIIP